MKTKQFLIFLLSFSMILAFPVRAQEAVHDHTECTEAEIAAAEVPGEADANHVHTYVYEAIDNEFYHIKYCTGCSIAAQSLSHDPRMTCQGDSCSVCGYQHADTPHTYVWTRADSTPGAETHQQICEVFWYTYCFALGDCGYCSVDLADDTYIGSTPVDGYHHVYRNCYDCGAGVSQSSFMCFYTEGYNFCTYCDT